MTIEIAPVGHVRGGRAEAIDDHWGDAVSTIVLDAERFSPDALMGLDGFSHALIVFLFDRVDPQDINTGARHPRGNTDWPRVGIFAQRGSPRPNRIGVTAVEIVAVEATNLTVRGLDAIDGTPVLDIKPVMRAFEPRGAIREPHWVAEIMREYW